jgi:hypothetical protein
VESGPVFVKALAVGDDAVIAVAGGEMGGDGGDHGIIWIGSVDWFPGIGSTSV